MPDVRTSIGSYHIRKYPTSRVAPQLRFYHDDAKPKRRALPAIVLEYVHDWIFCPTTANLTNLVPAITSTEEFTTYLHRVSTNTSSFFTHFPALGRLYGVTTVVCIDSGGFSPSFPRGGGATRKEASRNRFVQFHVCKPDTVIIFIDFSTGEPASTTAPSPFKSPVTAKVSSPSHLSPARRDVNGVMGLGLGSSPRLGQSTHTRARPSQTVSRAPNALTPISSAVGSPITGSFSQPRVPSVVILNSSSQQQGFDIGEGRPRETDANVVDRVIGQQWHAYSDEEIRYGVLDVASTPSETETLSRIATGTSTDMYSSNDADINYLATIRILSAAVEELSRVREEMEEQKALLQQRQAERRRKLQTMTENLAGREAEGARKLLQAFIEDEEKEELEVRDELKQHPAGVGRVVRKHSCLVRKSPTSQTQDVTNS